MIARGIVMVFLAAASATAMASGGDIWRFKPAGLAWGADFSGGRTSSPNGISATLAGNAAISGRYLALDGSGDWMTTDDAASLDVGDDFTVSVWVRPNAPGTGATRVPVGRYDAANNKRSWVLSLRYADTPQRVYGVIGNGTSAPVIYAFNQALPTSGWHHYCMVYSNSAGTGQRVKMYYDGSAITVSTILIESATSPFATDIGVRIGNDNDGTAATAWKGDVGTVQVFASAKTSADAAKIYHEGAARIAGGGTP